MRITFSIVMFYIWVVASANLVEAVGLADNMGVTVTGPTDRINQVVDRFNDLEGGGVTAESIIGAITVAFDAAKILPDVFLVAPKILAAVGLPPAFIAFLHAPLALLAGRFVIYALSGRDL